MRQHNQWVIVGILADPLGYFNKRYLLKCTITK